jgi:hypothetical protein
MGGRQAPETVRRCNRSFSRWKPVLTWWQGTGLGGLASGTDNMYNDHYQQIATVN